MRLRCARASFRASEESSERGRFRGGPSTEGAGDGADDEGDGKEEAESNDGLTVVADIALRLLLSDVDGVVEG
jgi:hypothetical protein